MKDKQKRILISSLIVTVFFVLGSFFLYYNGKTLMAVAILIGAVLALVWNGVLYLKVGKSENIPLK